MNKVLILGDGLLATELVKQSGAKFVSRTKDGFDITDKKTFYHMTEIYDGVAQWCPYNVIINAVGCTDTYSTEREKHWDINYKGVADLVDFCNNWKIKLVHLSTDYIYANSISNAKETDVPVHCNNWYGYTKLLGDAHVQLKSNNYLIVRSAHKPNPFIHKNAWTDQTGNFDYVDVISKKILHLVDTDQSGIFNMGTSKKTMYELAKYTKEDVSPITCDEWIPNDVSMNANKLNEVDNE